MGTREVYEQKLRRRNVYDHDPTMNPGLGSPRCPRCLSLLDPTISGESKWKMTSVLHDAAIVAGSGVGALLTAVHGFGAGIPLIQTHVKGPKWVQWLVGVPALLSYAGAGGLFGAYALPRFAELTMTSYYVASTTSHYTISQITRRVEGVRLSDRDEKSR